MCERCYRAGLARRGTCVACGDDRRLVDPPGTGALRCADCAGQTGRGRRCTGCGAEDLTYAEGRCARCALAIRARRACSDPTGQLRTELAAVCDAIAAARQPYSALNWLERSASAALLAQISTGALSLTHEALDAAGAGHAGEFLRQMLVSADALPARDEALARLEVWVIDRLGEVGDDDRARLLRAYATWRVLRRARQRAGRAARARTATRYAKASLLAAIALCDWLAQRDVPLSEVRQGDIDDWLVEGGPSARSVRDFLDWTAERKTTARLVVPGRPSVEGTALDDHARWAIVERLLHDGTIDLTDRVAGCLVLVYAQQLSRLVSLTVEQVVTTDDAVHLRLGFGPVVIPEPLGHMLVTLATGGRAYVGVGSPTVHTWLFPGLYPGRPLHPSHLGQRLARYGIAVMPGRRAALMHLASRLPAAVLAEMLNLHPTTAVHWVAAAGGDWNTYAAQIVRDR